MVGIFHILIITILVLSTSGCGYKGPPYYPKEVERSTK
ncbi:lipoprotein [Sulfurimonas sp. MAG313]|nr:lipoprotein [Sulfurimonas sp. MAG313]